MTQRDTRNAYGEMYEIGYAQDWTSLVSLLRHIAPTAEPGTTFELTKSYWDTHDWRLYRKGWLLETSRGEDAETLLLLRDLSAARTLLKTLTQKSPGFATEFEDNRFARKLEKTLSMRRLLPMATVRVQGREVLIRDDAAKQIGSIRIEKWCPNDGDGPIREFLIFSALRGYERQMADVRNALVMQGNGKFEQVGQGPLEIACGGVRRPGDYDSKPNLSLVPEMPAAEAVRIILRQSFQVMEDNERGILEDLDSEFLHDYRVAVRRSRSVIKLMKEVFDPAVIATHAGELRRLQAVTGPARDMDVYFLNLSGYLSAMRESESLRLDKIHAQVEARKAQAHLDLCKELRSKDYRAFKRGWRSFLKQGGARGPRGDAPILELADESIWRFYRRVCKRGGVINESSPAEALHDLRKDCKNLRYVLEFFGSLYPASTMKQVVSQLKRLQDFLGHFQDLYTHYQTMEQIAEEISREGQGDPETMMTIGRLLERMSALKKEARADFKDAFIPFAAPRTEALMAKVLRGGKTDSTTP